MDFNTAAIGNSRNSPLIAVNNSPLIAVNRPEALAFTFTSLQALHHRPTDEEP